MTKTGLVVGTPEFMSPEQLSGDNVDGRSDLYALALVFYQMLTGKLPFDATTVQETMIKRLTDEPLTLAACRPDLTFPAGLQAVLDTALARTPVERYQTVAKLAADVASVTGARRGGTAAVPETRAGADAKTQLLDAKPRAVAKRSLIPVVAGAVLVLGAGGAWVALSGGNGGDTPASPDTSATVSEAQDTGRRVSGGQTVRPVARPDSPTRRGAPTVDPAAAAVALNSLADILDERPKFARDSALVLYNAAAVSAIDKAMAAFVIANTFWKEGDRARGCEWISRAKTHDPATRVYARVTQEQCA